MCVPQRGESCRESNVYTECPGIWLLDPIRRINVWWILIWVNRSSPICRRPNDLRKGPKTDCLVSVFLLTTRPPRPSFCVQPAPHRDHPCLADILPSSNALYNLWLILGTYNVSQIPMMMNLLEQCALRLNCLTTCTLFAPCYASVLVYLLILFRLL